MYDADGNEVEGVLSPEEAKALQEKTTALEEKAKLADDLQLRIAEKEAELEKLSSKDTNFTKLRNKSEAEIEALKTKMSEKDKMVLEEVMDLRREKSELEQKIEGRTKADILKSFGADENMEKKIDLALKEIGGLGNAKTPEEIEARYRTAYIVAQGVAPTKNPIFSGYSASYREPDERPKNFTETEQGKDSLRKWFPDLASKVIKESPKS